MFVHGIFIQKEKITAAKKNKTILFYILNSFPYKTDILTDDHVPIQEYTIN